MIEPTHADDALADAHGDTRPPRRRRGALVRKHALSLCCAQSVAPMVEEIARNLRGLGFHAVVVCGEEARSAVLGHGAPRRPTIHVVCVHGSQRERLLRPLRDALATHGGADQHLFVAVLDVSTPLAMVGQIRRFAETLERTPTASVAHAGPVPERFGDRRRWREHLGQRELAERPTRPQAIVPLRGKTGPIAVVDVAAARTSSGDGRSPGPHPGVTTSPVGSARARAVRIGATGRQRPVTAPHGVVERGRPRGPARHRLGGLGALALPSSATTPTPVVPTRGDTVIAPVVAPAAVPPARPRRNADSSPEITPAFDSQGTTAALVAVAMRPRARWPWLVIATAAALGALVIARPWERISPPAAEPVAAAETDVERTPTPRDSVAAKAAEPAAPAAVGVPAEREPAPNEDASENESETATETDAVNVVASAEVEAQLRAAVDRYRVLLAPGLYVSRRRGTAVTWTEARMRCQALVVDGVDGWRLPWRRELKAIGVSARLKTGHYWSFTVPDDDRDRAFVYDAKTRKLAPTAKTEPAADVICVKRR